jgi:hypothetical protein
MARNVKRSARLKMLPFIATCAVLALTCAAGRAADDLEPGDPFAAIDGDPIYLGELNLVLTERLRVRDLDRVPPEVQQATAALLVRRHLAMKSMEQQGGAALESLLKRYVEAYATDVRRRGSSLKLQAEARMADEKSLVADMRWRKAWSQYLQSRLNDTNLRRFFEQRRRQYAGTRWDVSQIFVKADMKDATSVAVVEGDVAELAEQIRQSPSPSDAFSEAAILHSESPTSDAGGRVGWVEKDGDLPKSVMQAIRSSKPGDVAGPIRSPLGVHLVMIHDEEEGKLQFEDLTDQAQLRRDAANALFDALISQQADAKISWFVSKLKPPPSIPIIPR